MAETTNNIERPQVDDKSRDPVKKTDGRPRNLLETASLWSKLTFGWPAPILQMGMERTLEESDLPELPEIETSNYNLRLLDRIWGAEKKQAEEHGRKPSLQRAIFKYAVNKLWFVQPMMFVLSAARIGQALALGNLIEFFQGDSSRAKGYSYAAVVVLCGFLVLMVNHHVFFHTWKTGMQLRIATIASIYSKTLRLGSIFSTDTSNSGQVMNLASNDVERFLYASIFLSYFFWGPVEAIAVLIIGYSLIGPPFAAGYALLFIFIPLQIHLSKKFAGYRGKIAKITDARVTLVSQAISGIRVVKMSGWELSFVEKIQSIRRLEAKEIQSANRLKAWNEAIFFATNVTVSVVIFLVQVLTGGELRTRDVFTTISLINIVQLTMTKFFSFAVMSLSEVHVSIHRVQEFLDRKEVVKSTEKLSDDSPYVLSFSDVTCCWEADNSASTDTTVSETSHSMGAIAVNQLSLKFESGKMYCIIGSVGCGKSALLQAITGELLPSQGQIARKPASLAYAPQDPFIMDGSIRENILFGLDYDEENYRMTVEACGLDVDFGQFQNGDMTIVGDRGVQCSGGQRARIGLARALYKDADILVADDPLSAVDAKVGRLIFYHALQDRCVAKGKCVILATHQHQFIRDETCILMAKGQMSCLGSYKECVEASGGKLHAIVDAAHEMEESTQKEAKTIVAVSQGGDNEKSKIEGKGNGDSTKESKAAGVVKLSTWAAYAKSMGGVYVGFFLAALYILAQGSVLVSIAQVGRWAEKPKNEQDSTPVLILISGLTISVIILSIVRALSVFFFTVRASRNLHDEMTFAVLRAKIEFFDTNPIGRILNRFSADVGSNDDQLPATIYDFFMCAFIVVGGIITAASVLPFTLAVFPFLIWYFVRIRNVFVTSSRELKRLEALARSPVFAMMSESLSGIATIRANDAIEFFRQKFEAVHDSHTRAFFIFIAGSRWLGFRMDTIMFVLLALSSFLAVLVQDQGWFVVDPAILGLALTLLLQLAGTFQWAVRQSAELTNQMVSVERVSEYSKLTPEAPLSTDADAAAPDWPSKGAIDCHDLSIRYRSSLPPALTGATFRIEGGERVGCVGRTGAGKSSLVQALLRILEAEKGQIEIDGIDISSLGLHKLRHQVAVIPQTPVLFSGSTIMENIDPFGTFDEQAVRKALRDVQMLDAVDSLPQGLNSVVAEGGSNFSVGQRQLLCLARAILRRTKILILDEPSANVDKQTDQLLQEAVSANFPDSTIIAVAHRLDTVIAYDKIVVLGGGRILEFGAPKALIEAEGDFAKMVEDTGSRTAQELRRRSGVITPIK